MSLRSYPVRFCRPAAGCRGITRVTLLALFLAISPIDFSLLGGTANAAGTPKSTNTAMQSSGTPSNVVPPSDKFSISSTPSTSDLEQTRLFAEPLFPLGGAATDAENARLATALTAFATKHDNSILAAYVRANPNSPWVPGVLTNLGLLEFQDGYFSKALADWQQAWTLGKDETNWTGKLVIDRTAAELIKMYCRVGRVVEAEDMLKQTEKRPFQGLAANMMHDSVQATRLMDHQPKDCFKCGPYALGNILSFLHLESLENSRLLEEYQTTKQGTSLSEVLALSAQMGLKMQAAKRVSGSALPLPCVVHWKLNHYGALLKEKDNRYLLKDPTFGQSAYVLADAVAQESDGYFLIPAGPLPSGWVKVEEAEASQVFGRGQTSGQDPGKNKKNDKKCCDSPASPGMPVWAFHYMLTSLHIEDTPVGYTPPFGPAVNLTVTYNHRETNQPSVINYPNFGPLWNFGWISTITFDTANAYLNLGSGGIETYTDFNTVTNSYAAERDSSATLVKNSATNYERDDRDGSKMIFALADPSGRLYLTQIVDQQGNPLTLSYDSHYRLTGIADPINPPTTFTYGSDTVGNANFYLITKVTDPFGRSAQFAYQGGQLQSITDAVGNTSSFVYGPNAALPNSPNNFIKSLTTPYGTTQFTYTLSPDGNTRSLLAQEPNGAQQRVDGMVNSAVAATVPPNLAPAGGFFYNGYLNYRNSFYWDRKAMELHPGDINSAHIFHFFHDGSNVSEVVECEKPALENWIWYAYQNQTQQYTVSDGMLNNVTQVGRVLDDGTTQLTRSNYNALGNLTQRIDPLGRVTNYSYYSNEIDLQTIRQVTGAGTSDLLATLTYNSQHEPLTYTDRAGQQTQYTYNARGQILTVTNAKNETTTYNYTGAYPTSIQGHAPGNGALTVLGYDAVGRVNDLKIGQDDQLANDYELKLSFDNLDRLLTTTYPDGTFEQSTYPATDGTQNPYAALDVTQKQDRQGRLTNYSFNGLRQMISMTDANNHTVAYGWCACGSLKSIADANSHITHWDQDIEGRPISKTYPDGTQELITYEKVTDRIHSVTDSKGQTKVFSYNVDDTLASTVYLNAANPTPPVKFTYDPVYRRVTSMQDGIGSTNYSYYPVTGGPSLGAGQVSQVVGPWQNSAVTYSYDQLGRVLTRSINGVAATNTYDSLGRINNVVNALGSFTYTFDNDSNRVSTVSIPNGQHISYSYLGNAGDHRLQQIQNFKVGGANLSTFGYPTYNAVGTIDTWTQATDNNAAVSYKLGYDNIDQLLSATAAGQGFGYGYDPAGNRQTETINGVTATAVYNSANQIEQVTPAKAGDKTYQWDAENRVVAINYSGTVAQTQLRYDGLDRPVEIVELNAGVVQNTRRFLWCGLERCEERDAFDNVTKRFFDQGEQIYGASYYTFTDHLGSVREMTDGTGALRARYGYDFYGRRTKLGGDLDADFGFTGLYFHAPSALDQAVYRAYDPNTGRWLSRDPIAEEGGLNLYGYCFNNPTSAVDPFGLDSLNYYQPGTADWMAANSRGTSSNEITVGGHGSKDGFVDSSSLARGNVPLSAKDLADAIKHLPDYNPNKPVTLYQCSSAAGPNSPAQQLSKYLPNPITGSTTDTSENIGFRGGLQSGIPHPTGGGKWQTFRNGAPVSR